MIHKTDLPTKGHWNELEIWTTKAFADRLDNRPIVSVSWSLSLPTLSLHYSTVNSVPVRTKGHRT